jgi:hypothetical protein
MMCKEERQIFLYKAEKTQEVRLVKEEREDRHEGVTGSQTGLLTVQKQS